VQEIEDPELIQRRLRENVRKNRTVAYTKKHTISLFLRLPMNSTFSKIAKAGILIILLSLVASSETVRDVNNPQPVVEHSVFNLPQVHKESTIVKELLSHINILLGFGLGLLSTCFIDYLRNKRKMKKFYQGMQAELKQTLATMCVLAINPDANITKDKVASWISLSKEFNLHEESFPLRNDTQFFEKITLNEKTLNDFITLHNNIKSQREKEGAMQSVKMANCTFIKNNISCISLMRKQQRSNLFNILRYIDESIHDRNRERLRMNYQSSCQHISDLSYEAAKEIAHLLR
jgi:hypothetical protein